MPPVTTEAAQNRVSRRPITSVTGVTSVAATGVVTIAAGFLDDLVNGDIVVLTALTGGSSLVAGQDYYVFGLAGAPALGATTCQLGATPSGALAAHGSDVTAGTITKGKALAGQGDYGPSPGSARAR